MPTLAEDLAAAGLPTNLVEEIVKNEKVTQTVNSWREGGMRQSDYDRRMNSGKAELDASRKQLDADKAAFEEHKKQINAQFLEALDERAGVETTLATIQARARKMKDVYGIEIDKELFEGVDVTPSSPDRTRKASPDKTLVPDASSEFKNKVGELEDLFKGSFNFNVQMFDIAREHAELFPDKPLVMNDIVTAALKQQRTPREVWDDMFGAKAKREDLQAEKYREEGRRQEREAEERRRSERMVNPLRDAAPTSPIFKTMQNRGPASNRNTGMREAIARATDAMVSGKYAPARAGADK